MHHSDAVLKDDGSPSTSWSYTLHHEP